MANINFNTVSVASAINDTDYLHATIGGSHNRITVETLIAKANAGATTDAESRLLDKWTDGCFVMYHKLSDNVSRCASASAWTQLQSDGEVADGVLVSAGSRHIVVAPTGSATTLKWSSAYKGVQPSKYITDRKLCFGDFDGQSRTAAIVADETIGGDGTGYAPGFCNAYSRSNGMTYTGDAANYGMKAGRWWLPSFGELWMMFANKQKINTCLSLITGATTLTGSHWSSTEYSQYGAWGLYLTTGSMYHHDKTYYSYSVRAVSAFYL